MTIKPIKPNMRERPINRGKTNHRRRCRKKADGATVKSATEIERFYSLFYILYTYT